jgi:hypothetical protein
MKRYTPICFFNEEDGGAPTADMADSPSGLYVLASDAEAAVKQARIDALEEAKQACEREADGFMRCIPGSYAGRYDWKEDGARDCVEAIESLKGKTP